MIKKAQIKFICITMSILLAVFAVIVGVTCYFVYEMEERHIESTLEDAVKTFLRAENPDAFERDDVIVAVVSSSGEVGEFYFDGKAFSENEARSLINEALSLPYSSGRIGNVFFLTKTKDPDRVVVASDMTEKLGATADIILRTTITVLVIYGILFLFVTALSFIVFRPIRDSFNAQKRFISDASHELKTPLTIISANAEILGSSEKNQWVTSIKSQTERMETLISDMLTLAKMDEGMIKPAKEKFDLTKIVVGSALPFDALAFEKGLSLTVNAEPDITYTGDPQSVKKTVNILLDNAVKYAETGGRIVVTLKKNKKTATLSVFNDGSNVDSADAEKIFGRFYRGDNSRSRETGGSGLGLSIAKSIADSNKWKIYAESHFGVSMKITVIF